MVKPLDLEEQEQIEQLKHYWHKYGNVATWSLTVVLLAYAGWNGWQYWQNKVAAQAAAQEDALMVALGKGELETAKRIWSDLKRDASKTVVAQQAALAMAQRAVQDQAWNEARALFTHLIETGSDAGLVTSARLGLVAVHVQTQQLDSALKILETGPWPAAFEGLKSDRLGDVLQLKGQQQAAIEAYTLAYTRLSSDTEYQALVAAKLNALGAPAPKSGSAS